MKTYSILALFFTLVCVACDKDELVQEKKDVNLDKGLIAYYPFDGNANDVSGNGNHGNIVAGSISYDRHGYENSAFLGDMPGSKVVVANNGTIKLDTAFSVSFHVSTRSWARQNFVGFVNNENGFGATFGIGTNQFNNNYLNFGVVKEEASCEQMNLLSNTIDNRSETSLRPEAWYNIVCTFRRGELHTYVNGSHIASKTDAGIITRTCAGSELIIGGWSNDDVTSLNGKIDEVRIYNRVLTSDEVKELSKSFQQIGN